MASLSNFSRLFSFAANTCLKKSLINVPNPQNLSVSRLWNLQIAGLKHRVPWINPQPKKVPELTDLTINDESKIDGILAEINRQVSTETTGRLFAVVHVGGKQFKVTTNDIIIIQGYWPPNPGDHLTLEKVLLVGSTDFTLVGRPLLNKELVSVDATVIEKTFSTTKTHFKFKPRKQYRRINFCRVQLTMLRIKSINIKGRVGERKEVEGLDRIY